MFFRLWHLVSSTSFLESFPIVKSKTEKKKNDTKAGCVRNSLVNGAIILIWSSLTLLSLLSSCRNGGGKFRLVILKRSYCCTRIQYSTVFLTDYYYI